MDFILNFKGFPENKTVKHTRITLRYLIAIVIPLLILGLLSIPVFSFAKVSLTLLFFAGVVLSAANGGYKSGLISTLLSSILISIFFTPPYGIPTFLTITGALKFILFLIEGTFLSVIIDIVGKRTEIGLYKIKIKELRVRIEELEHENHSLRQEIRSRDEFLSIASHELKTPLTSMLLQTQHALHSIKNVSMAHFSIENLLKMLETVESQTKRLSRMINDLLNISLITTGNMNLEYEAVHLNALVGNVIEEFGNRLKRDNIQVTFHEEDIIEGTWDRLRVEQAVTNLLSNAIRYGENKPIEITIKKYYSNARIIISDTGIGMSKATQKKIFDLFERGVSQDTYKGLGVGLFITRQIVNAHHGSLTVESKENHGSTFIIDLPIEPPKKSEHEAIKPTDSKVEPLAEPKMIPG